MVPGTVQPQLRESDPGQRDPEAPKILNLASGQVHFVKSPYVL